MEFFLDLWEVFEASFFGSECVVAAVAFFCSLVFCLGFVGVVGLD